MGHDHGCGCAAERLGGLPTSCRRGEGWADPSVAGGLMVTPSGTISSTTSRAQSCSAVGLRPYQLICAIDVPRSSSMSVTNLASGHDSRRRVCASPSMIGFLWIGRAERPILDWPPAAISRPRPLGIHLPPVADRRLDATRAAALEPLRLRQRRAKHSPARPVTTVPAQRLDHRRDPGIRCMPRRQSCRRRPSRCCPDLSLPLDASLVQASEC
jgi:hypothetical protein